MLMLVILTFFMMGQEGVCTAPNGTGGGGSALYAPATLGGTVNVDSLTIPSGHTTSVTSDVVINATGKVKIDGELRADTAKDGAGYSIVIEAGGDLEIGGTIRAGAGSPAASGSLLGNLQATDTPAEDASGKDGGDIRMRSGGDLTILANSWLFGGHGTDGMSGKLGGAGGNGGHVILCAGKKLTMRGNLSVGNGGNGGDASDNTIDSQSIFPNKGGDSGFLFVLADSYDWPGLDTNEFSLNTITYSMAVAASIGDGYGGHAGSVSLLDNIIECVLGSTAPATLKIINRYQTIIGTLSAIRQAADGGDGWWIGGNGGGILLSACGHDSRDGSNFVVQAGKGGNVTRRQVKDLPCAAWPVVVVSAIGGYGGTATGTVAPGLMGETSHSAGGNGGKVQVVGGNGGHGEFFAGHSGGNGGRALASGGFGGSGLSRTCGDLGPGGIGGNGGDGEARGGDGGDGVFPGNGGEGVAIGSDPLDVASRGGDGGAGNGPGSGGVGGKLTSTTGKDGLSGPGPAITATVSQIDSASPGDMGELITPADCQ
jgi:hypothetical protein